MRTAIAKKPKPRPTPKARRTKIDYTSPERVNTILKILAKRFPNAHCALVHKNAFQLLVATILSAQCTDVRVNKVTPELFAKYPTPQDFAAVEPVAIEPDIRTTGFFHNKAKSVVGAARKIVRDFKGKVPQNMDDLLSLPGVARKTANVVLGTAFDIPSGVVVDTHVFRVTHRLKLTEGKTPEIVEKDLKEPIPQNRWISFGHQVIWFGREICHARMPECADCPLEFTCDAPDKTINPGVMGKQV